MEGTISYLLVTRRNLSGALKKRQKKFFLIKNCYLHCTLLKSMIFYIYIFCWFGSIYTLEYKTEYNKKNTLC